MNKGELAYIIAEEVISFREKDLPKLVTQLKGKKLDSNNLKSILNKLMTKIENRLGGPLKYLPSAVNNFVYVLFKEPFEDRALKNVSLKLCREYLFRFTYFCTEPTMPIFKNFKVKRSYKKFAPKKAAIQ